MKVVGPFLVFCAVLVAVQEYSEVAVWNIAVPFQVFRAIDVPLGDFLTDIA